MLKWFVGKIMFHAMRRDIERDSEFLRSMQSYQSEIDLLTREIEADLKKLNRTTPRRRRPRGGPKRIEKQAKQ